MNERDSRSETLRGWLQALLTLILLMGASLWVVRGQRDLVPPMGPETAPEAFSALRAQEHLRAVAAEPHPIGSTANQAVRDYLVAELEKQGLEAEVQKASVLVGRGRRLVGAHVENVLARLPGASPRAADHPAVLLASHYDSVPWSPGAGDDGSGVSAMLETLRALRAGPPLGHDVLLLFTDGEEAGLLGAQAFVEQHRWASRVGVVLNLDARGSSGPSIMFRTSGEANGYLVRALREAVPDPLAMSLTAEVFRFLPNNTDLAVFEQGGMAGMDFAFIGGHERYHSRRDLGANLSASSLQHHGEYLLHLTRYLAGPLPETASLQQRLADADEVFYFSLLKGPMVVYPAAWGVPLAIAAAILVLCLLGWGLRAGHLRLKAVVGSALTVLVIAAVTAILSQGVWQQIFRLDTDFLWMPNTSYETASYRLGFSCLFVGIAGGLVILLTRIVGAVHATLGALLVWMSLAVAAAFLAPGAGYLFLFPAVGVLLAVAAIWMLPEKSPQGDRSWLHLLVLFLGSLPLLWMFPPVLDLLFDGLGLPVVGVIGILFALPLSLLAIPISLIARRLPALVPLVALAAAAAFLIPPARQASFSIENPRPTSLFYGIEPEKRRAFWASGDLPGDPWVDSHIQSDGETSQLDTFVPWSSKRGYRIADAPLALVEAPQLDLVERSTNEQGVYFIRVEARSLRETASMALVVESLAHIQAVTVNGQRWDYGADPFLGQPGYLLTYFGPWEDPVDVTLELTDRQPVELSVVDLSHGLPPAASPRPPETMPRVHRWWSDGIFAKTTAFF